MEKFHATPTPPPKKKKKKKKKRVYISQLVRVVRVCYNVNDFNNRNQLFTAKLLITS